VATTIAEQLRGTDVARRRGTSDFWVILPETGHESARVVAERIRLSLGAHDVELAPGKVTRLSLSLGIASFPEDGVSAHELVKSAERALSRAVSLGGNRTVLHSVSGESPAGWGVKRDGER
jgi:diguanylate cyclase (GGDEF)-like protein